MNWIEAIAGLLVAAAIVNTLVNGRNTAGVITAGGNSTANILSALTKSN